MIYIHDVLRFVILVGLLITDNSSLENTRPMKFLLKH